ncbi:hypothetical protein THRCLA_20970 [Thraustotheca clavata]|uniref:Myb-like domain-containing protein n=1 Tax=Thraustotheca clavata TaxID=74557 RepID=A0A1W0A1Q0_9STRA|nr:hypothetical protein THRCLA_20970 [Thraustotheca clavata]
MLQVNEDMITAIAEHQNWSNSDNNRSLDTAHAYQRILHQNLIEMANFVDSLCGVFVDVDTEKPPPSTALLTPKKRKQNGENTVFEPSALQATIQATEHFRARRRTEKEFATSQLRVKEQEGAQYLVPLPEVPLTSPSFKMTSVLRPSPMPRPEPKPFTPTKNRLVAAKEVCLECYRLGKSVSECRAVWKHTTPSWKNSQSVSPLPPQLPPQLVSPAFIPQFAGPMLFPVMYPPLAPALGKPMIPPAIPSSRVKASSAKDLKRMCEKCRAEHQSVYQCRTVLSHTDPEWKRQAKPTKKVDGASRTYSRWTDSEMHTLHELLEVHGYSDATILAPFIPTKDIKQIKSYLQRYLKQKTTENRKFLSQDK